VAQSRRSAFASADSLCHQPSEVEAAVVQILADSVNAAARSRNLRPYHWNRDGRSGMDLTVVM